ncbi:MAG: hypothetical protein ACMXX7_02360 [Candidatus Woesearchaeota archaeon]
MELSNDDDYFVLNRKEPVSFYKIKKEGQKIPYEYDDEDFDDEDFEDFEEELDINSLVHDAMVDYNSYEEEKGYLFGLNYDGQLAEVAIEFMPQDYNLLVAYEYLKHGLLKKDPIINPNIVLNHNYYSLGSRLLGESFTRQLDVDYDGAINSGLENMLKHYSVITNKIKDEKLKQKMLENLERNQNNYLDSLRKNTEKTKQKLGMDAFTNEKYYSVLITVESELQRVEPKILLKGMNETYMPLSVVNTLESQQNTFKLFYHNFALYTKNVDKLLDIDFLDMTPEQHEDYINLLDSSGKLIIPDDDRQLSRIEISFV